MPDAPSKQVTVPAVFDEGVIKPLAPLDLPAGTRAQLRVAVRYSAQIRLSPSVSAETGEKAAAAQPTHAPPRFDTLSLGRALRTKEALYVLLIIAVAAGLRFYRLSELPTGLHGDEAVSGLEARRILREGSIGPYAEMALGQPAGPLYLTALSALVFGENIFAVRFIPALFGTLTVLAFYLLLRRHLGTNIALLGALLLATLNWHIHFSRIGFPLATWPFLTLLVTGALLEALARRDVRWWALAGFLTGFGIYVYNAHPLFAGVVGLFVIARLYPERAVPLRQRALWLAAFAGAGLVAAIPMILYAINPAHDYGGHFRLFSLFEQPEWKTLGGPVAKAQVLAGRYFDFWDRLSWHPRADGADGTGADNRVALVPPPVFLLALAGLALGLLFRRRNPLILFGALAVLILPFGSVITIDGLARRTFALAPFIALFAAVGIDETVRQARARRPRLLLPAIAAGAAFLAFGLYQSLHGYFRVFAASPDQVFVFTEELTDAAKFMRELPADRFVYFYSDRWSFNYETRQWLAAGVKGEDRSNEYGRLSLEADPAEGRPVFVLLGKYLDQLPLLQQRYPGGQIITGRHKPQPSYIAYLPPG